MSGSTCDVVVLGAGAAGLSGATALARSRRSVVVVDGGDPRNAVSGHAHNVLGREGIGPLDLLAQGRREAQGYGVRFVEDRAVLARRDEWGFVLELLGGATVRARRLLLATGLTDELPDVPGLRRFWGRSVLHCAYCHGWEVRGQRIGVLGTRPASLHQALVFRQLSEDVTVFVQDLEVPAGTAEQFDVLGVRLLPGTVRGVSGEDGNLRVDLDGTQIGVQALVVTPYHRARAELFAQLGGELATNPVGEFVPTQQAGATEVPGVWAAGNVTDLGAMVQGSSAAGVLAGMRINHDLVLEDVAKLLAAR
ncbi:NAD(P)/FAD-dependent oxidoreductase [Kineococcus sp. SYSU DK003]|uniref:NAD(P)/FAD-dependent oxidoreductase n=1 Tax=Kineococcus sp. SYSU DK003 TaxID=3383124 RepID=UPI003D7E1507